MQTVVTRIDILRTRASWPDTIFSPAYVMSRERGDGSNWWVADSPVPDELAGDIFWASAASDEYIRIPLFEYRLSPQGDLALAHVFKLGVIAASAAPVAVKKMYVITGNPVELIQDSVKTLLAMTYWLGFAFSDKD